MPDCRFELRDFTENVNVLICRVSSNELRVSAGVCCAQNNVQSLVCDVQFFNPLQRQKVH